jgi:hypothetical protein
MRAVVFAAMGDPAQADEIAAELQRVRAERDALEEKVETLEHPHQGKVRGFFVGLLVVVTCLAMLASVVGIWARRNALDRQVFADRVAPLASDPNVQAALATFITNEVMMTIDPESIFKDALPDQASILAVPLSSVVETFVMEQVEKFLASDAFAKLWAESTSLAHNAAVDLLEGKTDVVGADGDTLVINLVPIVNAVLAQIGEVSPDIFGNSIDIPTITVDDIPEDAIKQIEDALNIDLPSDYGVIRVKDAGGALGAARDSVQILNFAVLFFVALTVVCVGLALWISRRRRRTILQLVGGLVITFVVFRRIGWVLEDDALQLVKVDVNRGAAQSVLDVFLDPLFSATTTILWILSLIGAIALITGPYPWAVNVRRTARQLASTLISAAGSAREKAGQEETVEWIRQNLTALQVGGGVVAFFLLVWLELSFFWLLVLALVVGAYEYFLWRLDQPTDGEDDPDSDPQSSADPANVSR